MGEVIKLHETDIEKFTRELHEQAQEGKLRSIMVTGSINTGETFAGICNMPWNVRAYHLERLRLDFITRPYIDMHYVTPDY